MNEREGLGRSWGPWGQKAVVQVDFESSQTQVSCGSYLGPQAQPHSEDVAHFLEFQAPAVSLGTLSLQGLLVYSATWNHVQVST